MAKLRRLKDQRYQETISTTDLKRSRKKEKRILEPREGYITRVEELWCEGEDTAIPKF